MLLVAKNCVRHTAACQVLYFKFFWKIFKIFYLTAKMRRTQRNFNGGLSKFSINSSDFFIIYYFFQIITINIMRRENVKKLGEDK